MGSVYGKYLKITMFGESHGAGIGVVLDNFPAGIDIDFPFIEKMLSRRAAGTQGYSTKRKEADRFEILSGVYQNKTTGTPICAITRNEDTHSEDYRAFSTLPRPSHGDFTGALRYCGYNDPRGGGHFSGRLTAPLVFAGALALLYLKSRNISVCSHIKSIADCEDLSFPIEVDERTAVRLQSGDFPVIENKTADKMLEKIANASKNQTSLGGVIECMISGMPQGVGSPIFDNCESRIAALLFAVPAVKGVEFGTGFDLAKMTGDQANDSFYAENGRIKTKTNHSGGLQGGITNGMPIVVRAAIKPTASISLPQKTVDLQTMQEKELIIKGRHDSCIVPRAVPVIESACALAAVDLLLEASGYERA